MEPGSAGPQLHQVLSTDPKATFSEAAALRSREPLRISSVEDLSFQDGAYNGLALGTPSLLSQGTPRGNSSWVIILLAIIAASHHLSCLQP